jgi:Tfp pilus assembly protein PilX
MGSAQRSPEEFHKTYNPKRGKNHRRATNQNVANFSYSQEQCPAMKNPILVTKLKCFGLDDESGIALLFALLVSVLMLGLSLSLLMNSLFEVEIASNHERGRLAFYAALTGMERAIDAFRNSYNTTNLPEDGAALYTNTAVSYTGSTVTSNYSVSVARRDAPATSIMAPYPIHYTITSTGSHVPANTAARVSSATLTQTVSVSPRTLANFAGFWDEFPYTLSFSPFFKLTGRLAVNDPAGVNVTPSTSINGDFYAAGAILGGPPIVSGNVTQNGGQLPFPTAVSEFTVATASYTFTGPTRIIFLSDGNVTFYNSGIAGGTKTVALPADGMIAVTGTGATGDVVVEGTINGRATVTATSDILINGNLRYANQSSGSWDTLALVAAGDVIVPEYQYASTNPPTEFSATYSADGTAITGVIGGSFGSTPIPPTGQNLYIDATLVSLSGSSNAIVNPFGRPPATFSLYGNTIGKKSVATMRVAAGDHVNGLTLDIRENKKLDLIPPPGFPQDTRIIATFFIFREVRTILQ